MQKSPSHHSWTGWILLDKSPSFVCQLLIIVNWSRHMGLFFFRWRDHWAVRVVALRPPGPLHPCHMPSKHVSHLLPTLAVFRPLLLQRLGHRGNRLGRKRPCSGHLEGSWWRALDALSAFQVGLPPGYCHLPPPTLQSMMNARLSLHGFWHCNENWLIKTIQTIPHNLYVSFKLTSLYCGFRINQDKP